MQYKNVLTNIKFEELLSTDDYDAAAKSLLLVRPWILPQALAHIAEHWTPQKVGELYSAKATLENIEDPWSRGLWTALVKLKRSLLVPKQASPEGAVHCALVPLILAAYKKYHAIPYSAWNKDELKYIVDKHLLEAMLCSVPKLTADELLQYREQGLTLKTGPKAGQMKSPLSTWRLYNLQDTPLHNLPPLAQTMLTQIWCAHPQLRNNYMVLDPTSWDHMPTPLLVDDVFASTPPTKTKPSVECVSPWD